MKGLACLLTTLMALPASASAPVLSGAYMVGAAGLLDFSSEGGSLVGRYRAGGQCAFSAGLPVVTGALEGAIFVGSVLLCQEGSGCSPQRTVPLLAIGRGDLMVGLVKLERGCSSPAVAERRLLIRPATPEEQRQAALAPPAKAADPAESGLTATRQGQAHLGAGHYQEAREAFDVALRYGDTNYVAWLGLGTAQVKLGEYAAALVSLQRAQVLAQRDGALGSVAAQAQYDLACVYAQQRRKPEALKAIAQAARLLGPDLLDEMEHDPDLEPIRSEPEFRRQAAALRAQRGKTQR